MQLTTSSRLRALTPVRNIGPTPGSLDRLDEDGLILAFGRWAEGQIKKWIDYSMGALLFVIMPDDPESGMFCVYDRKHQAFWMLDPVATSNFGGYRLEEFDQLAQRMG